jgi:proteasome lid subunit RPN8/RPN11
MEADPMIKDALAHAKLMAPVESCGLIVNGEYIPCRNISKQPKAFTIDPDDYRKAAEAGRIEAVVHSHPTGGPTPSDQDRLACDASGLPWVIVDPVCEAWYRWNPTGMALPLVGRAWVWGVADCWSLVREWYQREQGITLRDFDRPAIPEEFQADPLFDRLWREFGFRQLAEAEPVEVGDVALMSIGGPGLNHVGVIVENGEILHHLRDRLSSREIYGGWLQKCTGRIVRYGAA